ncbi:probable dolichyl pyrophosphate Glc1Man9GlcNAc2 alpha-1,3-glucosyltransferase [Bacillus rossius redtenbacheri]|uniref:probable dolichyl pyrophosphate Glc1Man9GlcNAc2 alpha-1,3-glucosyltransferase n=1 Tax=Bacillus rossius redtenbacheri TaxID=93214 RepID=UPI002FDC9F26
MRWVYAYVFYSIWIATCHIFTMLSVSMVLFYLLSSWKHPFWIIVIILSCLKTLFIPAYRSTDFEVHRNWLAVTHSLPVSQWYQDATSEWTLDYPPLFAWFEWTLSQVARFFDPEMLKVSNLNYASPQTIYFQRLSVIVADLLFAYGTKECVSCVGGPKSWRGGREGVAWGSAPVVTSLLLLGNAGLLMVDHVHFQYNGYLLGFLLLSVARMFQGRCLEGAFWFAILLNHKHIFMYVAPAYFVYLLRSYCFSDPQRWRSFSPGRLARLALVVLSVCLVSFGPFIALGQLGQVLTRLFPFKRGLCHAYWAPNAWALYNAADKMGAVIGARLGHDARRPSAVMTGGLVQEYQHAVLPSVTPGTTFLLTALSVLPAVIKLWRSPANPQHFVRCMVLCACSAFMFGWHVHEKAVLLVIIPLTILAALWKDEARLYLFISTVGHYSLFPLLFTPFEIPVKLLVLVVHSSYAFLGLSALHATGGKPSAPLLSRPERAYLAGLVPLFLFDVAVHPLSVLGARLPFLSLMLTSVYCAVGVAYFWLAYYWRFLTLPAGVDESKYKNKIS